MKKYKQTEWRGDRVGEKRRMSNGLEGTIVRYGNASDIDVSFFDGACIAKSKGYSAFLSGKIRCPMLIRDMGNHLLCTNYDNKRPFSFRIDGDGDGVKIKGGENNCLPT